MKFTLFDLVFSVTRKPRQKHNYSTSHKIIAEMPVGAEQPFYHGAHPGRCALSDALVKGAKRNGVKVKSSHKDGQLVVRRVA